MCGIVKGIEHAFLEGMPHLSPCKVSSCEKFKSCVASWGVAGEMACARQDCGWLRFRALGKAECLQLSLSGPKHCNIAFTRDGWPC